MTEGYKDWGIGFGFNFFFCSLQGLLEKDPAMRATWAQILCHPFVEGKLYINPGVKAENSPFINPQSSKSAKETKSKERVGDLSQNLSHLQIKDPRTSAADNLVSSRDSINAIPASDIENLETDVEDCMLPLPFAESSYKAPMQPNLIEYPKLVSSVAITICF